MSAQPTASPARTLGASANRDALHARTWASQAACAQYDPDEFFTQGADQNRAKQICRSCPVRTLCLADALDNRIEYGVWGGTTERERRRVLRQYPRVTNWLPLVERTEEMDRILGKTSTRASSVRARVSARTTTARFKPGSESHHSRIAR